MNKPRERLIWIVTNLAGILFGFAVILGSSYLVYAHSLAQPLPDFSNPGNADYSPYMVFIIQPFDEKIIEAARADYESIHKQIEKKKGGILPGKQPKNTAVKPKVTTAGTAKTPSPTVKIILPTATLSGMTPSATPTILLSATPTWELTNTASSTAVIYPTLTSTRQPTVKPKPTRTLPPEATNTPVPRPTNTSAPRPTNTHVPAPTHRPSPTVVNTPRPTAYPGPDPTQSYP